jgi:cell division protein FtsQ
MRTKNVKASPLDVRLMNALATTLFVLLLLALMAGTLIWAARLPVFAIQGVSVTGDVSHYNAITLRANVIPRLQGTFFTIDLHQAKQVFESMPWVRRTSVSRDFPNRLKVSLQEHRAVAYWGNGGDTRLVNSYGEVFEANLGELEKENLPRLSGPKGQSAQVLTMFHALNPRFEPLDLSIDALSLSPRGGWRAQLASGTALELGSGEPPELLAKVDRFLDTVTQVTGRYQRAPEQLAYVDLRHVDGYAIRLEGVATLRPDELKKR